MNGDQIGLRCVPQSNEAEEKETVKLRKRKQKW